MQVYICIYMNLIRLFRNSFGNEDKVVSLFDDDLQTWTNYLNNANKYLIIGAVVSSEYSSI